MEGFVHVYILMYFFGNCIKMIFIIIIIIILLIWGRFNVFYSGYKLTSIFFLTKILVCIACLVLPIFGGKHLECHNFGMIVCCHFGMTVFGIVTEVYDFLECCKLL